MQKIFVMQFPAHDFGLDHFAQPFNWGNQNGSKLPNFFLQWSHRLYSDSPLCGLLPL